MVAVSLTYLACFLYVLLYSRRFFSFRAGSLSRSRFVMVLRWAVCSGHLLARDSLPQSMQGLLNAIDYLCEVLADGCPIVVL